MCVCQFLINFGNSEKELSQKADNSVSPYPERDIFCEKGVVYKRPGVSLTSNIN